MQKFLWALTGALMFASAAAQADITVKNDAVTDLALSIYNNTALVRDVRSVRLPSGKSSVLFAGVSAQIKPESVIVNAEGVSVREQNYNFAMLSPENVARENIGKVVKTVLWDEDKGKNIYDKARIIDVYAGQPVLQFGYGIEFSFPGRIIWDSLPDNLQTEPSLSLGVEAMESGDKKLDLMYLTGGLRWSANYVAEFLNEEELNLKSWVSISNTSGVAYNNANVRLVAGEANVVRDAGAGVRPVMMMRAMATAENAMTDGISYPTEESVGEYHVYSLPDKISIADNQTKQVSLLSKDRIKYTKEFRLNSPLYLDVRNSGGEFKKVNSDVYVKLVNNQQSNLGEPLPRGVMRFYDHDSKGSMLFVGEAEFKQLAVGNDTELKIGRSFDVTASGKVTQLNKIAENTVEAEVSVTFMNAKSANAAVVFEQHLNQEWKLLSSNIPGEQNNARSMRWTIDVPAQGSAVLNFKVRLTKVDA